MYQKFCSNLWVKNYIAYMPWNTLLILVLGSTGSSRFMWQETMPNRNINLVAAWESTLAPAIYLLARLPTSLASWICTEHKKLLHLFLLTLITAMMSDMGTRWSGYKIDDIRIEIDRCRSASESRSIFKRLLRFFSSI